MAEATTQPSAPVPSEPKESGASGEQKAQSGELLLAKDRTASPIAANPMVGAIARLYAAYGADLGGQVPAILIPAIADSLSVENAALREELNSVRRECNEARKAERDLSVKIARLEEKEASLRRGRRFRDAVLLLCPFLFSVGVALSVKALPEIGVPLCVIAIAGVLVAWFSNPTKPNDDDKPNSG